MGEESLVLELRLEVVRAVSAYMAGMETAGVAYDAAALRAIAILSGSCTNMIAALERLDPDAVAAGMADGIQCGLAKRRAELAIKPGMTLQ